MSREETRYRIEIQKDEEENVYFVQTSTLPGVHLETESYDEMLEVICDVVPELLVSNLGYSEQELSSVFVEVVNLEEINLPRPHILREAYPQAA